MMERCEVKGCGQSSEYGVIYGGKRGCPDCFLRHCDPNDPMDFKKPETWEGEPAVFMPRPTPDAVAGVGPAAALF